MVRRDTIRTYLRLLDEDEAVGDGVAHARSVFLRKAVPGKINGDDVELVKRQSGEHRQWHSLF